LPNLGRRPRATRRRFVAFVARKQVRYLVRQRPAGVVNAHLWEFPNIETALGTSNLKKLARKVLGSTPKTLERICTIKHSITRYRITLEAFKVGGGVFTSVGGRWLIVRRLHGLPFTSAHKRILRRL